MKKKSHRRWTPGGVTPLEGRTLLAAALPTATWIGQDGVDLVGRSSVPGPDGVQDIDIALAGLPTNVSVVQADIIGYGGGEWEYNGPPNGPWAAALVQAPGSSTADLYIEPYQVETGRYFWITFTYSDQSTATVAFMGGTADPNLRMPGNGVNLQWLGQDGQDWTGPDAGGRPRWVSGRRHRPDAALGHRADPVGHPDVLGRRVLGVRHQPRPAPRRRADPGPERPDAGPPLLQSARRTWTARR